MNFIKRNRLLISGLGIIIAVGGFLAFRPDKLFVDDVVSESLADAFTEQQPAGTTTTITTVSTTPQAEMTDSVPETAQAPATTEEVAASTGPTVVTAGEFYGIDHTASGSAAIYEQDGAYVLRFEDDTDIQNGPDLYVYLLPEGDYDGGDPLEYVDLGKLKGNVGGQNYELPDAFDPAIHQTVLIWCLRFGVPFAAAPLG